MGTESLSRRLHYRHFAQHIRECSKAGCEYTKSSTLSSFPQCYVMHILCQGALKAKGIRNAWLGSWVSSAPYFFSSSPTFVSLQGTGQKRQSSSSFTIFLLLFHILRLFQIGSWAKIWPLTNERAQVCDRQHSVWSDPLGGIHFAVFIAVLHPAEQTSRLAASRAARSATSCFISPFWLEKERIWEHWGSQKGHFWQAQHRNWGSLWASVSLGFSFFHLQE